MKKWLGRIAIALLVTLIVIQFIPVARSNPPQRGQLPAPPEVQAIFKRACNDCHSNASKWPWYSRIAPVSMLIAHDVKEGRKELNFSLWDQYSEQRKTKKLKEIIKQVEKGDMPLWYYVSLHPDAKLSATDRELIIKWAKQP